MKKGLLLIIALLINSSFIFSQAVMKVKDKNKINQLKSQEFMQWDFSPEWYYKSWWKLWGVSIPGLGIHDNGPAGSGAYGDKYVQSDKRNVLQTAPMNLFVANNKDKSEEQGESTDNVYKQHMAEFADRTVDYQYILFSNKRKKLVNSIRSGILEYGTDRGDKKNITALYKALERIEGNIEIMHKAHLSNSKKREMYIKYEKELKELNEMVITLNELNKLKFIDLGRIKKLKEY